MIRHIRHLEVVDLLDDGVIYLNEDVGTIALIRDSLVVFEERWNTSQIQFIDLLLNLYPEYVEDTELIKRGFNPRTIQRKLLPSVRPGLKKMGLRILRIQGLGYQLARSK